jgi:cold shock protein
MARGTVKWFNSQKGYGFIQPQGGGKDVFIHISAVEKAGLPGLNEGQVIDYEEVSNRGKTSAENLKVQRWSLAIPSTNLSSTFRWYTLETGPAPVLRVSQVPWLAPPDDGGAFSF